MTALELLRRERSALIACNTVYNSAGKSTGMVIEPAVGAALAEYDAAIAEVEGMGRALNDINSISSAPSANHYHGLLSAQALARSALSTIQRGVRT